MGKSREKYPVGLPKPYLIGVKGRESSSWMRTSYLRMKGDLMAKDLNQADLDLEGLSKEVDKFLEEKEKYIRESIIGSRTIEELEDFTLDVGIKRLTYAQKTVKKHILYWQRWLNSS